MSLCVILKHTPLLFSFCGNEEEGSSFQALQSVVVCGKRIFSGMIACLLKCSDHFMILVV